MSAFFAAGRALLWHGHPARDFRNLAGMPRLLPKIGRVAAFFTALFFVPAISHAETVVNISTVPDSDASIQLAAPWNQVPRFGFAPVRIAIVNRAPSERTWRFRFQAGAPNLFPGTVVYEEAVAVGAGQTRDTWVFVPIADPGVEMVSTGAPTPPVAPLPPVVEITDTPTGKKVSAVRTLPSGATYVTENEIYATTGARTITTSTPTGKPTTRTQAPPKLALGSNLIFTIDPNTGNVMQRVESTGTANPSEIKIVTLPLSPSPSTAIAGSTTLVTMSTFTPASSSMLAVDVTGPEVTSGRQFFNSAPTPNAMRPFAVSAALEAGLREKLSGVMPGGPNLAVLDPAQLPADWRLWSAFAGVILTGDEYAGLDAARKSALRSWVGLGGKLFLVPVRRATAGTADSSQAENFGAGSLVTFSRPVSAFDGAALANELQLFLGSVGLPDHASLMLERGKLAEFVRDQPMSNAWLAVFLVGFAAIVGPVNLFLFAPAKKRHRLFITTPLIALVASVLLAVTILLQDGTGGHGLRRIFVSLLPGENAATVIQEQAVRTGFLTSRSFALPDDVALTMLPLEANGFLLQQNELLRSRGNAAGAWFESRGRQAHQLRRIVPTRARIEQVGWSAKAEPIVQSSMGTTLRDFRYRDAEGKTWMAAEIPSGEKVTLKAGSPPQESDGLPRGTSPIFNAAVATSVPEKPGGWRAKGGPTDFAPIPTLRSIRWEETDVLYTGFLENAAKSPGGAR